MGAASTSLLAGRLPAAEQYVTTLTGLAEALQNLLFALALVILSTLVLAIGTLRAALAAGPEPR
jgi:hypothetical protein